MSPELYAGLERVLAVRLDNIGDVIMLGPALRTLRRHFPQAEITLLATPGGSQAAALLPWVDRTWVLRPVWQDLQGDLPFDPQREFALIERLRQADFDAAFIFTSFTQSPYPPAYACYLAGIPLRFGQSQEFGGQVLSHRFKPPPDSAHQVDRNLSLLEQAGLEPAGRELELRLPAEAEQRAADLLRQAGIPAGQPYIALVPGASAAARRYPPRRFGEVARELSRRSGLPLAILGSEREIPQIREALDAVGQPGVVSLVGQTGVSEMAAVLKGACLALANNSAALHLADALGTPLLVLYSGTELESQWAPRGRPGGSGAPARLLRVPVECSPCYRFECPYQLECLDIPPLEVVREALEMLALDQEQALRGERGAPAGI